MCENCSNSANSGILSFPSKSVVEIVWNVVCLDWVRRPVTFRVDIKEFHKGEERRKFLNSLVVDAAKTGDEESHICPFCGNKISEPGTCKECYGKYYKIFYKPGRTLYDLGGSGKEYSVSDYLQDFSRKVAENFLKHIDSGSREWSIKAHIIMAESETEFFANWNLPLPKPFTEKFMGHYIFQIWRAVDKRIKAGEIPCLTDTGCGLVLIDDDGRYKCVLLEIERELGFRIPPGHEPFQVVSSGLFVTCDRCGEKEKKYDSIRLVNGTVLCGDCAQRDPHAVLMTLLATPDRNPFNQITGVNRRIIDTKLLKKFYGFKEVGEKVFDREVKSGRICLQTEMKHGRPAKQFFVSCNLPEGDIFEDKKTAGQK